MNHPSRHVSVALWLMVVVALFCLPLFIGLGRQDLHGDEAAYSFGVDRILEIGQWMEPKSSPNDDAVFLEKPPLKFWIVAASIRSGLLPNDEFGLRFWDALFGGVAFLYVFAIARRLGGALGGAAAVMLLFVHEPLLFEHGLRSNNMEAPLVLCYCGGIYHYLAWTSAARPSRQWMHALATGLYFVLGFLTKDVAALFLPFVLGLATLAVGSYRTKWVREWRVWTVVSLIVVALVAPWFIYAYIHFGSDLWDVMFARHVYTRFTSYLDPAHLQPWDYYFVSIGRNLTRSQSSIPVLAGLALLTAQTIRRRAADGLVILLWFLVPLSLISIGTSKLYHYAYPFLPPLAVAGGYFVGSLVTLVNRYAARALQMVETVIAHRLPAAPAIFDRPPVRALLLAVTVCAAGVLTWMTVIGPLRVRVGHVLILSSADRLRPLLILLVAGFLSRAIRHANVAVVLVLLAIVLPLQAYRDAIARLDTGEHPMRTASDCVRDVAAQPANANVQVRGMSMITGMTGDSDDDDFGEHFGHEHYYYFHRMRPIRRTTTPQAGILEAYLYNSDEQRPVLIDKPTYLDFRRRVIPALPAPPLIDFEDGTLLLLPGPYAACAAQR